MSFVRILGVLTIALLTLAAGACADADDTSASSVPPSTTSTSTSTSTQPTTTAVSAPSTTSMPTTTIAITTTSSTTTTEVRNTIGALGSGCTIGDRGMPDGHWFGFVESIDHNTETVKFDLACFFVGDAAAKAAADDGFEFIDYYIRNRSSAQRILPYDAEGTAYWIDATDPDLAHQPIPIHQWPSSSPDSFQDWCAGPDCAVWLHIDDGSITELKELYLP